MNDALQILTGDCRETLKRIPAGTVHCCVTSPPYWGLRSYLPTGHDNKHMEIGGEPSPEAYVETMVWVFREVRRCLHDSGTLWLNVGDSYSNYRPGKGQRVVAQTIQSHNGSSDFDDCARRGSKIDGVKEKDLCLIPWRLVMALQADGWWVRSVICWAKKSCMPESVTDRPTNSWEPIFLLAKSQSYFFDAEAVKEPMETEPRSRDRNAEGYNPALGDGRDKFSPGARTYGTDGTRNQRNVWHLGPEPYAEAHFATFPTEIPRRAILAGTSARGCCPKCFEPWVRVVERIAATSKACPKTTASHHARGGMGEPVGTVGKSGSGRIDGETRTLGWEAGCECGCEPIPCTVLDPFGGSGTTGSVAMELGRRAILCELNEQYVGLIENRCQQLGLTLA